MISVLEKYIKEDELDHEEWEAIQSAKSTFVDTAAHIIGLLAESFLEREVAFVLTDENGVLLWYQGFPQCENPVVPKQDLCGRRVCESVCGTTAIGLALKTQKAARVKGTEHESTSLSCFAAPIFDGEGKLLGAVGLSLKNTGIESCALAMVGAIAKAIENEIALKHSNWVLSESNKQIHATLSAVSDGVVYVEGDKILRINKTMSEFLGKPESEVIYRRIGEGIITFPGIEESLKKLDVDNDVEIMITGAERNYDCLLNVQTLPDAGDGYVLCFTRTDEIKKLARKINKYSAYLTFDEIIGKSFSIREALTLAKKVSNYNYRIMIEGESGTGKEMFARAIHNSSPRRHKPFITFDCGAMPHELFEKELFGFDSTDFIAPRFEEEHGKLELANGGTLYLDDITNMPMDIQAKLFLILQEEKITRPGEKHPIPLDVRIVAASSRNVEREVRDGNFRSDLFYRLNVVLIRIPPLRERREDISLLVRYFLNKARPHEDIDIEKKAMAVLERYQWPGNVRELHNAVERALMMCEGNTIRKEDFALNILDVSENDTGAGEICSLNEHMKEYVIRVLEQKKGNISEAARVLNVSRATVYNILNRNS